VIILDNSTEKALNDLLMDAICFATDFYIEAFHRVFEINQSVLYLDIANKALIEGVVEGYHVSASANSFEILYEVRLGDQTVKIHPNLLISSEEVNRHQPHNKCHDCQNQTDCNCTRD
jgi:hypothetical protein